MSTVVSPLGKHKVEIDERIAAILHPHPHQAVPRFYGYARASLDKSYPVPVQEEELRRLWKAAAEDEGVQWGGVFSDGASAVHIRFANRKRGRELILRLEPGDHVAMTRLDRAFWDLPEALKRIRTWIGQGVIVHVLDCGIDTKTEKTLMVP